MTRNVLLGDIAYVTKLAGYEFTKYISYDDGGEIIALRALNLRDGRIDLSDVKRISRRISEKLPRSKLAKGDILLSYTGTVGNFAIVEENDRFHLAPNVCLIRANEQCLPDYLYYVISTTSFRHQLLGSAHGSTQATVPMKNIRNLKVPLSTLDEQESIVSKLKPIDEKIELNRKMNETLERLGHALFRHYFIDNPEAEKWENVKIGELVDIKGGGTPSTKDPDLWDGDIAWTSPRDLTGAASIFLDRTDKTITAEGLAKVSSGLLPVGTLLLSSRAPIGYTAITSIPVAINQGYIAFIPDVSLSNYFMYFWLKQNMERIKGAANGSTFMEISKSAFRNITAKKSDEETLTEFDMKVESLFRQIKNIEEETQTLTALRDTLLPRLINGKVGV
jgi:type I restriction enzyme S subunit